MRHWRICLIIIAMQLFLPAVPCSAGKPTPAGGMPDVQFANLPDIVLPPIVYKGPVLDDIGMKLISYTGPDLSDITLDPIHFSKATLAVKPSATLTSSSAKAAEGVKWPVASIPGTSPGVKIISPKPGQTVMGNVLLEVQITGWLGTPGVDLAWWWSAPTPSGHWPSTPKRMTVVSSLNGKSRVIIPASAFPETGQWRVEAEIKVSDNLRVSDDVSFKLAGAMHPHNKTAIKKKNPKQTLPGTAVQKPDAVKKRTLLPSLKGVKP
jgi:hypothetical protein